jgi:putative heme-binding domain-containing protein
MQPRWLPALRGGKLTFGGNAKHLVYLLQSAGSPDVVAPLVELLRRGELPADRQESVLLVVAALGGPQELRTVLDLVLDDKADPTSRAQLLASMAKAARMRKVRPSGDLNAVAALVEHPHEPLQVAAIEVAGLWQLESLRDRLAARAAAAESSQPVRRAALAGLADMGPQSASAVLALCKADRPRDVRALAIAALAALDVQSSAAELVSLLRQEPQADPAPAVLALLERRGGAAALTEALNGQTIPSDATTLAVRAVRSSAREEPALVAALSAAGGIASGSRMMSHSELNMLVDEVTSHGNAQRGEAVFRRADQQCLKCHAIAGAGGQVGPDLAGIGASAQVDYLVESILQPTAKIKENYHSLVVVADGRITSGVRVRQTESELVLRDSQDREVNIPLDAIEEQKEGGSLMPIGLADPLTRAELVDLVRFLSELGKVGPYAATSAPVARRWQALAATPEASAHFAGGAPDEVPADQRGLTWTSVYSCVGGNLPLAELPAIGSRTAQPPCCVVRCQVEVATAGRVGLVIEGPVEKAWFDANSIKRDNNQTLDVSIGSHTITLLLASKSGDHLRLELAEVAGSPAQAQLVGGK